LGNSERKNVGSSTLEDESPTESRLFSIWISSTPKIGRPIQLTVEPLFSLRNCWSDHKCKGSRGWHKVRCNPIIKGSGLVVNPFQRSSASPCLRRPIDCPSCVLIGPKLRCRQVSTDSDSEGAIQIAERVIQQAEKEIRLGQRGRLWSPASLALHMPASYHAFPSVIVFACPTSGVRPSHPASC